MAFSADILEGELSTLRFGRACRILRETPSTIDAAWEWLRAGGPEGAVVVADRQTRGRGRLGRAWASPEGGLWMTVVSRPGLAAREGGRLGIGLALAAAEGVAAATGLGPQVKWPNDIVLGGRKVGGVLVETEVAGGTIEAATLSLGLNVNVSLADLPEQVRPTAGSLREAAAGELSLEAVAAQVLEHLERIWPLVLGQGAALAARWREWDALAGAEVCVQRRGDEVRGRVIGVDRDGALVLGTPGGEQRVEVGEVHLVRAQRRC